MRIQINVLPLAQSVTIVQLDTGFSGNPSSKQVTVNTVEIQEVDNNEMTIDVVIVSHEESSKEVPLHISSRCGNQLLLKLLIPHEANINLVDDHGRTNLHCVNEGGHEKCLILLLDSGW